MPVVCYPLPMRQILDTLSSVGPEGSHLGVDCGQEVGIIHWNNEG